MALAALAGATLGPAPAVAAASAPSPPSKQHCRYAPAPSRRSPRARSLHRCAGSRLPTGARGRVMGARRAHHAGRALSLPSSAGRTQAATLARVLATPCQNAQMTPEAGNLQLARAAVLCLINRERALHGEQPLV